jgi:3-oxoacyl-[acyl-carrier protein] reductase
VRTDISSFTKTNEGRDYAHIQALKRLAEPENNDDVTASLASENARWITSDTINVDGGSKL